MTNSSPHPRDQVAFALAFAGVTAFLQSWWALGLALLFAVYRLAFSPMGRRVFLARCWRMNLVIAVLWILIPWSGDGSGWFPYPGSYAHWELPARVTQRANAILMMSTAVFEPMGMVGLIAGLRGLGMPPSLLQVLSMTVRYYQLSGREFQRLRCAMSARGFRPAANLQTYQTVAQGVGMLLVRSLDRSERVHQAVRARTLTDDPHHPSGAQPVGRRFPWPAFLLPMVLIGVELYERGLSW